MWHVLEHVYDLKKDLKTIKQKLKKDGSLIVAVPNCASHDAEKYKEFWAAYDLPIHLYHFRPQNIKDLFDQYDMEVVDMKPMKFDSYYISLISEQYKNNQKGGIGVILRGFYYGLVSNLKAKKGEYSSQIYIIKNK
jgi:2-polyprenyl-3-methyl-5-hydroxy-6-metoxy-1,4-benzoquinol methylase